MSDTAAEAKSLMNNEAFVQALESARAQCLRAAMACPHTDDAGRWKYLTAARVVEMVAGHINGLIIASKTGDETNVADYYEEKARRRWSLFQ